MRAGDWTSSPPAEDYTVDELMIAGLASMFGDDDPLGHPILGDPAVIASAEIANVSEFHRAAYSDPSIVLSAAGNVDHDALCELASSLMGSSPRRTSSWNPPSMTARWSTVGPPLPRL